MKRIHTHRQRHRHTGTRARTRTTIRTNIVRKCMRKCVMLFVKVYLCETHDSTVNWGKVVKFGSPCLLLCCTFMYEHTELILHVPFQCLYNEPTKWKQGKNIKRNANAYKKGIVRVESRQQIALTRICAKPNRTKPCQGRMK